MKKGSGDLTYTYLFSSKPLPITIHDKDNNDFDDGDFIQVQAKENARLEQQKNHNRQNLAEFSPIAKKHHRTQLKALSLPVSPHPGFELPLQYQPLKTLLRIVNYMYDEQASSA
jgi:hypothetical protein